MEEQNNRPQREDEYHKAQRERIDRLEKEIDLIKTYIEKVEAPFKLSDIKPKKGRPPKVKGKNET